MRTPPPFFTPPLANAFQALPLQWQAYTQPFTTSAAYTQLCIAIDQRCQQGKIIYPAQLFHALSLTQPEQIKVIILGQDPYHSDYKDTPYAHGLAFSVSKEIPNTHLPPSLKTIFAEIRRDLMLTTPMPHGCLEQWAQQGVFLLNTVLTVEKGYAASHAQLGWEILTTHLIHALSKNATHPLVFMLWGKKAQSCARFIETRHPAHLILNAAHPSPLSSYRGFNGCAHFSCANHFLQKTAQTPINWTIYA